MKANAFNNRSEPNDLSDLEFILRKMSDEGKRFDNVDEEDREILCEVAQQADQFVTDLISTLLA